MERFLSSIKLVSIQASTPIVPCELAYVVYIDFTFMNCLEQDIYISELYKRPLIYDLSSPPASCPPVISSVAMNDAWFSNRCTFVVQVEFILVPSATRFPMPKKNESSGVRMTEIRFTSPSGLPWRLLINLCSKYINVCVFFPN